jgi:hypothetical protein
MSHLPIDKENKIMTEDEIELKHKTKALSQTILRTIAESVARGKTSLAHRQKLKQAFNEAMHQKIKILLAEKKRTMDLLDDEMRQRIKDEAMRRRNESLGDFGSYIGRSVGQMAAAPMSQGLGVDITGAVSALLKPRKSSTKLAKSMTTKKKRHGSMALLFVSIRWWCRLMLCQKKKKRNNHVYQNKILHNPRCKCITGWSSAGRN